MAADGPTLLSLSDLQVSETAAKFEGRDHGASVSFFVTNHPPGAHVPQHHHPYEETFVITEGTATFTVAGQDVEAEVGQVVIVPAGASHGFANNGDGPLRLVSVHPQDHVEQEWLED